jgi:hypothetical protein
MECARVVWANKSKTHGLSRIRGKIQPEYSAWSTMNWRCKYKRGYADRGITVCERWRTFENFFKDMGERPRGGFLDRIDNFGNYEPSNCRWVTSRESVWNRRVTKWITIDGERLPGAVWAEKIGCHRDTIYEHIKKGDHIRYIKARLSV